MEIMDRLWIPKLVCKEAGATVVRMKNRVTRGKTEERVIQLSMDREEYHGYPRPHMVRDSYLDLNGLWEINPFMSGGTEKFLYRRMFQIPDGFWKDRVILHFGAVDQVAEVFINGKKVGVHEGGYLPFSFDITEYLKKGSEEQEIRVLVTDSLDTTYPYGKQTKKPGGMWYTPVSGIWQSVWMESVPEKYIEKIVCVYKEPYVEIEVKGTADTYQMNLSGTSISLCI